MATLPDLAAALIQEWIDTRNLDPDHVSRAEMNAMMWTLCAKCELPPHRSRTLIVAALNRRTRPDAAAKASAPMQE